MPASGFTVSSKLLQKKWDDRNFQLHQQKIKAMKTSLNNKTPKKYPHLVLRMKAVQKTEERQAQIEHDNQLLLQKMTSIMKKKGRIDNWNDYEARSLNHCYREREQERIARENRKIARSLEGVKPLINLDDMVPDDGNDTLSPSNTPEEKYKDHQYFLDLWSTDTKDWHPSPRHRDDEYESDFEVDEEESVRSNTKLPVIPSRESQRSKASQQSMQSKSKPGSEKSSDKLPKLVTNVVADNDAKLLFKASKGLVNAEEAIVKALIKRTKQQRSQSRDRFKELYDLDMLTELKSALSHDFHILLELLLSDEAHADVANINKAIHANDPAALTEALCALNCDVMTATKTAYRKEFEVSLEEDVADRILDEPCQKFLLALCQEGRPETTRVDEGEADEDAAQISSDGEDRFTRANGVFLDLMTNKPLAHIKAVMASYPMTSGGKEMHEDMKNCGCAKEYVSAMKKLKKCLLGADYWAEHFHDNLRPNNRDLMLGLMTHSDDAIAIKKAYKKRYGSELMDDVTNRCGKHTGHVIAQFMYKSTPHHDKDNRKKSFSVRWRRSNPFDHISSDKR